MEAAGPGPAIKRLRHPLHAQLMAGQCVAATGPSAAIQRLRHPLHAQLMAGQCGHSEGVQGSVADPNPDPSDLYVCVPPGHGSGSVSQSYGSDPSIIKQK